MKLKTRLIIAFLTIMLLPGILFGVFGVCIINRQVESIQEEYTMDVDLYDIFTNPLALLNRLTRGTYNQISLTANESPKKFEENDYLKELDESLESNFSFIILRKDNDIIYNGSKKNEDIEKYLPEFSNYSIDVEGGFYIEANSPFLLKQQDFYYNDGSQGSIFIITDVKNLIPEIKHSIIQLLLSYVFVSLLTAIIVVYWLYYSIIKPLNVLKVATSEITKGNLNYSIEGDPKDEIGQLCIDFEAMRIKIRQLLESQLENESNIKELVSNISHDLKTPITAIKGYSEGIIDGVADTSEKQEKYIKTIYNKVNSMSSLVDELMLYSKVENNQINYQFSKLNIDSFFKYCIEELSLDLEVENIKLSYENNLSEQVFIYADPEQLRKVINNIISNSVKYIKATEGLIHIKINEEGPFILISITDNGIGISADDLPFIFDRFYRTDKSRNSTKGGSGLGLSIAKKVVIDHQGKISAVSKEGEGTTIYIELKKYKEVNNE